MQPAGSMTNFPKTNTAGTRTESVLASNPSTLMEDDARSINDVPDRPSRPDEFPIGRAVGPQDCVIPNKLGKSKQWWDKAKHELFAQYGEAITQDLRLPRVLVTAELNSYEYLERAMEQCVKLSENDALPAAERMDAAEMVGYLADVSARKAKVLLEVADKAQKSKLDKPKRNLPPNSVAVQVNVGSGSAEVMEKQALPAAKVAPKHVTMGPQTGS